MVAFFGKNLEIEDAVRIAVLIFLSLLIKTIIITNVQVVNPDAVRYVNSAHELFQGNFHQAFLHEKMLFFSLNLGIFHWFFQDWFLAGQMLSVTFLTLTLIPLYYLTRDLFGGKAAFWACTCFIVLPSVNELSAQIIKGGPFLFFMALALFFGFRAIESRKAAFFYLTSLSACLASLYRLEGIVFIFGYFLFLVFLLIAKEREWDFLKNIGRYLTIPLLVVTMAFGILSLGVFDTLNIAMVWERFAGHYFQLDILSNYHLIYDYMKSVEEQFPNAQWGQDFFEVARHYMPIVYLVGVLEELIKALWLLFLVPLFWGLVFCEKKRLGTLFLFWMFLLLLGMNFFFIVTRNFLAQRYLMVVVLVLLPFIGCGMERFFLWSEKQNYRKIFCFSILVVMVFFPCVDSVVDSIERKSEIREAGEWIQSHRDIDQVKIMTTEERVLFHAGLFRPEYEYFPKGDSEQLEKSALNKNCDIIVVENAKRYLGAVPEFENFSLIREFQGRKVSVHIYEKK